jgi:iron-sulfur cluster repair protein YtfE (RIC family)
MFTDFMTDDHRACDERLATVEAHVSAEQWDAAALEWTRCAAALRCHFAREEQLLFPAFEQATGNTMGPTAVMRMEHEQMRAMFGPLGDAVRAHDGHRCLGLSESLMVLIQQHNMKEEQILYPMCDRVVPGAAALLARIADLRPEA